MEARPRLSSHYIIRSRSLSTYILKGLRSLDYGCSWSDEARNWATALKPRFTKVELISQLTYIAMNEYIRKARAAIIAELNDELRTTGQGGTVQVTRGVAGLGTDFVAAATWAVKQFNDFTAENDPYGEHDFGSVAVAGKTVYWKIDYYDASGEWASDDPANPDKTIRVLTIMLAEEY